MTHPPLSALFLTHTARPSGAELALVRLTSAMRDAGDDPRVLSTADGPVIGVLRGRDIPTRVEQVDADGVKIAGSAGALLRGAASILRGGWRVGGVVRRERPDVIVAESSKTLLLGAVAALRGRVPLVWHVHDRISSEYFGLPTSLALRLLGAVVARGYVANSQTTRSTLWTLGRPSAVSYPGVELDAVTTRRTQAAPEDVVIGMVGRLAEWKGQDVLLDALALMQHRPRVRLIGDAQFGEHDYRDALHRQAERLGLGERVTFDGHVDDPLAAMSACDIVVHCSRKAEPFGQVVVEGMAAGAAVVATGPGGPAEIVRDRLDGVLVDPNDPQQLATVLDELVADRALRERLADTGAERARDFTADAGAAAMTALLRRVRRERR